MKSPCGEGVVLEARDSICELERRKVTKPAIAAAFRLKPEATPYFFVASGFSRKNLAEFDESRRAIEDRPAKPITADTMACGWS